MQITLAHGPGSNDTNTKYSWTIYPTKCGDSNLFPYLARSFSADRTLALVASASGWPRPYLDEGELARVLVLLAAASLQLTLPLRHKAFITNDITISFYSTTSSFTALTMYSPHLSRLRDQLR